VGDAGDVATLTDAEGLVVADGEVHPPTIRSAAPAAAAKIAE